MSNDIVGSFINKKKAESEFLSLQDGESAKILKLKDIKSVTKSGFGGEEKEVLRFLVEVETTEGVREKKFDNGTARFAKELQDKGVSIGCGFTIKREGQQTKTRYIVSDVVKPAEAKPAAKPVA